LGKVRTTSSHSEQTLPTLQGEGRGGDGGGTCRKTYLYESLSLLIASAPYRFNLGPKLMRTFLSALLLSIFPVAIPAAQAPPRYAVAEGPTPVLNTPDFAKVFGGTLILDPCQGVRPVEFVALPGTLFRVEGVQQKGGVTVYRVTSNDYPHTSRTGYFVDARFLKAVDASFPERLRLLPSLAEVQQGLLASLGRPYVWGGNLRDGVERLGELYPEANTLAGVDCSGLLYEATDGYTARNSSHLTAFGAPVPVAGLTPEGIAHRLRPLDLIVYKGHVMVVLDHDRIIQSTMGCQGGGGVTVSPLIETLRHLMKSRKPRDEYPKGVAGNKAFVVRRWFPL
jgi:hypothetical protein